MKIRNRWALFMIVAAALPLLLLQSGCEEDDPVAEEQIEKGEVEVEGAVLEVVSPDRRDVEHVWETHRGEQDRHDHRAAPPVGHDRGDQER